jgi:hypothetical protein
MSQSPGIFSADSAQDLTASLAATTSTAEIVLGQGQLFALTATGAICIKFGNSGMSAASGSNFQLPANAIAEYTMGQAQDRMRLYNPGATSITYYIQVLDQQ